jgi:argininosuccinate lyase
MAVLMLSNIHVNKDILNDEKYKYLFSVEEVNKLVMKGIPFRDAYKQVGMDIENGKFSYSTDVHHTHEGSIGNLQHEQVKRMMEEVVDRFNFSKVNNALEQLLR